MNGEIEQMSNIVISARKALYEDNSIDFVPSKYVLSIKFIFAPKLFSCKTIEAYSVNTWFDLCKKRGLDDIKFTIPTATNQRHLLGFSNTSQGVILCFWNNGKASYFYPMWEFDREQNGWEIVYREQRRINVNKEKLSFVCCKDAFMEALSDIGKFATDIGFPFFSDLFHKAHQALLNDSSIEIADVPQQLPNEFKGVYYAVKTSDVFGAMGSWNDSPPCYAHEMGLDKEYNSLSDRLLQQIRYHLMYVTNECWKKTEA